MAVFLAAILVLGSLGTVVFATDAPVITDAYIAGFPVPGKYLHVIADGTYDGQPLSKTSSVTATYSWEYGSGDSWTAVNAQGMNRFMQVTSDMIGKTVRCTITPTDGTTSGTPVVVTFPTAVVADANAPWQTMIKVYAFDNEAQMTASGITARSKNTMQWDSETKSLKFTGWPTTTNDSSQVLIQDSAVGFDVGGTPVSSDRIVSLSYKVKTDQGTISAMQTAFETSDGITEKSFIGSAAQAIRGGFYGNPSFEATQKTITQSVEAYEVAPRSAQTRMKNAAAIMTPDLLTDSATMNYWLHPHMDSSYKGALLTDNPTAYFIDDLTITEKALLYNVTSYVDGTMVFEGKAESGSGVCCNYSPVISPLRTVESVTATNSAKAEYKDGVISVSRVFADTRVNITTKAFSVDRISLEKNTVNYVGTACMAQPLTVTLYDAEGNSKDVSATELADIVVSSSDCSVFTVTTDGMVSSTGKAGKSTITLDYGDKTASVMMIYSPTQVTGIGDFANQNWTVKTEANINCGMAKDTTVPGHNDSVSWSFGTSPLTSSYASDYYALRLYEGRNNWWDKGIRSVSGWFYDDLSNPISMYLEMGLSAKYQASDVNTHMAQSFGYGEFTEKWKDVTGIWQSTRLKAALNGTHYRLDDATNGTVLGTRTKGWHQILYSIGKDPSAELGWSVFIYLDGQQVAKKAIGKSASEDPHVEIRVEASVAPGDSAENTNRSLYPHRADDLMMGGSMEKDVYGVKYDIGSNGQVVGSDSADIDIKSSGSWDYITEGDRLTVQILPDNGYRIASVKVGDTPVTPNSNNEVTLTNLTGDTTLSVTFEQKPTIAPGIESTQSTSWFKTTDGKPMIYAYSKLNEFTLTSTDTVEYGMKLYVEGQADSALDLAVRNTDGSISNATPGAAFAIKAYGDAITSDKTYIMKPYVGTVTGNEIELTFDGQGGSSTEGDEPISTGDINLEDVRE